MKTFKLEDADKFVDALAMGFKEAAELGLLSAAQKTVEHIQTVVIPDTKPNIPVDRGIYKGAWRAEKCEGGAVVYNDSPAAGVIEDGAKGTSIVIGRKLIVALAAWIRRKGIGSTTVNRRNGTTSSVKATVTEATRMAFAIAQSMKVKGIFQGKGLKVLERAEEKIPEFIREEVAAEIKKEFK